MPFQTIIFDLDGTLTDPKVGVTKSVQYALKHMGINEPDLEKLIPFIGPPLIDTFATLYPFSHAQVVRAIDCYREYFADKGMYENRVYPGILELLLSLKQAGKTLAIASTKPTHFVTPIVDHFGLSAYFDLIIGSNLDNTRKDKVDLITYVREHLDHPTPNQAVMIGDREYDIIGAKQVGIDSIGVLWGYGGREELERANPTHLVVDISELIPLLVADV